MNHNCKKCTEEFTIHEIDLKFLKKFESPIPKNCPRCRMQKLMSFRNERNFFKGKCAFSDKDIISIYTPDPPYTVYDQKIWWSDKWDPLDYGQEFDFNRPFFEQYQELLLKVPRINLSNRNNENSEFCNDSAYMKNCYLCINGEQSENCFYSNTFGYSKDIMDALWSMTCEICYECTKVMNGYHCFWCFNCQNISDCYFCEECIGCTNCFGCVGLRQKQYYIFNQKVGKEKYKKFIENLKFTHTNIEEAKMKLAKLRVEVPHKNLEITQSENCLGDYISNSKNCTDCFDIMNSENSKYIWDGLVNNSYDCFNCGIDSSFLFSCLATYRSNNMKFCNKCTGCSDLYYCDYNFFCDSCFGCIGLRNKKYCILNKQFSKEEYFRILPKIIDHIKKIGEYGEYLPSKLSPFGYNDSMAYYHFPLNKEEAVHQELNWNDQKKEEFFLDSLETSQLPESIDEVDENITNKTIKCENDEKLFKIIPQELKFYKKHNLPIPHLCPDCRHIARKRKMNPRILIDRKCNKCGIQVKSTYSINQKEKINCEKCYLSEIY